MVSDKIKFIFKVFKFFIPFSIQALFRQISIFQHRWTYQAVPFAKEVVVIGGSFAGVQLARRLSESLPTGYKVTMIEKNSHFNFLFNFPRFSVLPRREQQVFIPYDGIVRAAPPGALRHVRDTVTAVTTNQICLASGKEISYAFVVIATGSAQPLPAKTVATDRDEACAELRAVQDNIRQAKSIAVIGGGAVGVELASDIKSFYPDKEVSLFHSRNQLLPRFGPKLHDHVLQTLTDMGIHIILNERPQLVFDQKSIQLADGRVAAFDFIIRCTGQTPNTSMLKGLAPDAISAETNCILVQPTLQIITSTTLPRPSPHDQQMSPLSNIFAIGDVAETGGPKMGRAGFFQAEVILSNIMAMIRGQRPFAVYKPRKDLEGAIKLTLGKNASVMYTQNDDGSELLIPSHGEKEDLDIAKGWEHMGVKFPKELKCGAEK